MKKRWTPTNQPCPVCGHGMAHGAAVCGACAPVVFR